MVMRCRRTVLCATAARRTSSGWSMVGSAVPPRLCAEPRLKIVTFAVMRLFHRKFEASQTAHGRQSTVEDDAFWDGR